MLPADGRQHRGCIIPQAVTHSPEDGQNNCPKHVELTGIINKPLLLLLVGCLYYLYHWCTVKQMSDNEIYLLIKYIKIWRVAKRLPYIEDARCLKVNNTFSLFTTFACLALGLFYYVTCEYFCTISVSFTETFSKLKLRVTKSTATRHPRWL